MKWIIKPNISFFLLFLLLSYSSCYEPEEGCLDIDAINYNVNADDACKDCCTLPKFDVLISYLLNGNSYSFGNDTITNALSSFILNDFHFIISDISLTDVMDSTLEWEDSFVLYDNAGSALEVQENDFRYFSKSTFRGSLAGMRYEGDISFLTFNLGLPESINFYNKDSLDLNTALKVVPESLYDPSDGYQFFSFTINDLEGNVSKIILQNIYPLISVSVDISPLQINRGFNAESNIFLDFGLLFEGVDIDNMSESEIENIILSNFSGSFGKR